MFTLSVHSLKFILILVWVFHLMSHVLLYFPYCYWLTLCYVIGKPYDILLVTPLLAFYLMLLNFAIDWHIVVFIYGCMCACTNVYVYVSIFLCVCMHLCMYVCLYVYMDLFLCMCILMCMYVCVCVCVCVHACVHVFVYVYVCK